MAFILSDRVRESNVVTGTGPVTCGGAVSGFQTFASVGGSYTTWFAIVDNTAGAWEVSLATYSAGQMTRGATPLSSSNGGAAVSFVGNACDCFMDAPASAVMTPASWAALNLSTLPTSDPGGGRPWLNGNYICVGS